MKKMKLLFITAILTIGASAFASLGDCPLKNLNNSPTLLDNRNAYHPPVASAHTDQNQTNVDARQ